MGLWDHESLRYDLENLLTQWKNEKSNWKEGTNITFIVEEIYEEYKLDHGERFILTDNKVLEGCFYKGCSNSQNLNGFVLRLRLV